ncbi:hypothetical protein EV192_1021054 [Actinocrispum wychmicini]|uniref:Uncharacterized protein n=1 Tax=Actinocrispum wychmicini TaxID=1213861 RepID=A0A4R2JTF2_9PSEU|nr:hypothetical protein EV192_1021054 [Actinocrispum wychmicini]
MSQLVEELKVLRRGRGILASAIGDRIGPALRALTGSSGEDRAPDVRRKVAQSLLRWAEELPHDLRVVALIAFGVAEDGRLPYYQDRVRLACAHLDRDERATRRRIDDAIERLAEVASAVPVQPNTPIREPTASWHTEELNTSLALDLPTPEVFETRRIVADEDNLDHVDFAFTLTADPRTGTARTNDLDIDIFHGGRLATVVMESGERYGFRLVLPKPLQRGESHQICLRFRLRDNKPMLPHYVCVPRHRCGQFTLRVRFDLDHLPTGVWRLAHAFQRDIEDPLAVREPVQVDSSGEIHIRFQELVPGLAYGVRWTGSTYDGLQTH